MAQLQPCPITEVIIALTPKQKEKILEAACDICIWPLQEISDAELERHCDACPVEKALKEVTG